jgi:hypothetical protein
MVKPSVTMHRACLAAHLRTEEDLDHELQVMAAARIGQR